MSFLPSSSDRLFVFIMAGGSGERFWPMSRTSTPKHLLRLLGEKTLLEQTIQRFEGIVPLDRIFVLTNIAQVEATKRAIPFFPEKNIIAEPCKRDTAPAAALATALALRMHPDALVALFPADAMIHDTSTFQEQLNEAATLTAESAALLTFSIKPNHPATGFGYLELGEKISTEVATQTTFQNVNRFVEKPTLEKAKEFLARDHYGWNAGMFLWQATSFVHECERQQPALATFIKAIIATKFPEKFIKEEFEKLPKISVDYAIMEKANHVIAATARFDWDDVGSWKALPTHLSVDDQHNTIKAPHVVTLDSFNNIVVSEGKTIALCGVQDLVVVETADALLICHRDAVEKIKQLPLPDELR